MRAPTALKEKTKESNTENSKSNTAFSVKYRGEEIVPGTEFSVNKIDEEANISEIPSCAFDGIDKIYTYKNDGSQAAFTTENIFCIF